MLKFSNTFQSQRDCRLVFDKLAEGGRALGVLIYFWNIYIRLVERHCRNFNFNT